ncbi:RadC family protein [Arundinibacter roseus]|uniref:DNA repair protein RadC n=1 Tax=Arundinibacter roseus TaxID=2070510 RepID=A0A4R4KCU7_9BACT|nr:DNA repair protein RadC [Arundinibacter roseus]TDB64682.1 DNA repair protein RadC [Arundinibacter roseus]
MDNESYTPRIRISDWAEEDRPREKLLLKGKGALTDAELIAILIGMGTVDLSAVDVAKMVLGAAGNNLNTLARMSIKELMKAKGIGEAKAITIVAALELGRRRKETEITAKRKITCAGDAYDEMRPYLLDKPHEEFWILLLSRSNEVMRPVQVSTGGVAGTVADPKLIFKYALDHLASSIILVHNHPSGNLSPSQSDKELTRKLKEAGRWLDLPILDHLIFTDRGFLSFADEGLL